MDFKDEIEKQRKDLYRKYCLSSPSIKRDLAYDLTELDTLALLLKGETIPLDDSNCEYVPYIFKFEMALREALLNEIDLNYEFYGTQAHNVLTRFQENAFDLTYHKRDNDSPMFTANELLEIAYEFLNEFDPKAYSLFKDMYENNRILSHNGLDLTLGLDGKCFSINALRKSFIMSRDYPVDLLGLSIVMHEFGHGYENMLLFDKNLNQRQGIYATFFSEVSAFFFENSFYEFLIKNKINTKESILAKDLFFYLMFEQFLLSYLVLESKEYACEDIYVDLSNQEFKRVYKQFVDNFGFELGLNNTPINLSSTLTYGNSMILSLNLHKLYQSDPKEFKRILDYMLMNYGLTKDNSPYKIFGIEEREMCEVETLDQELKLHNIRKNKNGFK